MSKPIDKNIIICPHCNSNLLKFRKDIVCCEKCNSQYLHENDNYLFVQNSKEDVTDLLDKFKFILKRFSKLYNLMIILISPVYSKHHTKKFIKEYITEKDVIAINLGSGNSDLSENISNIDLFPYENVNLTCNIENMPIENNSVDYIINNVVLEHVSNPHKVVQEMYRILKKGGMVSCVVPFITGFHASPHDYNRFTYEGMKILFKDFEIVELKIAGGPTSGLLWILQEWLALLLSFGSKKIHMLLYIMFMLLTFPVKFIDIFLVYHPLAKNIASSFYIEVKKR